VGTLVVIEAEIRTERGRPSRRALTGHAIRPFAEQGLDEAFRLTGALTAITVNAMPDARHAAQSFHIDVQEITDVGPRIPLHRGRRFEQRHTIQPRARQHPRHR